LHELKCPQLESTKIRVDNKSVIKLAKNPEQHERSKHIDVMFHSIRKHIKNEEVRVVHVQSNDQATDIFTKALSKPLFENCKQIFGMMKERDLSLREYVESSKLQVSIPKNQELGNPTISQCPMPNSKKRQHHQARASVKGKAQDGREPNSSRTSGSSG
jgi:hypothetical protein